MLRCLTRGLPGCPSPSLTLGPLALSLLQVDEKRLADDIGKTASKSQSVSWWMGSMGNVILDSSSTGREVVYARHPYAGTGAGARRRRRRDAQHDTRVLRLLNLHQVGIGRLEGCCGEDKESTYQMHVQI